MYYSFTNNVHTIVSDLRTQIEADVVRVEPTEKGVDYAANNYAIGSALIAAIRENPNDASFYPAIETTIDNLSDYDRIIIGAPLWWSNMAAPLQTFLFRYGSQMEGKSIDLIVSSSSSGISGVESDAKRLNRKGVYEGENHLRDDELNHFLTTIRQKLGDTGSLWVSLDACHSGSATRGEKDEWMRGVNVIFSANPGFLPPEKTESSYIDTPLSHEEGLSPLTVLSACRADQNNYEYKIGDRWYGVLTYSFCGVLNTCAVWPEPEALISALKSKMSKLTNKQRPVFETTQK